MANRLVANVSGGSCRHSISAAIPIGSARRARSYESVYWPLLTTSSASSAASASAASLIWSAAAAVDEDLEHPERLGPVEQRYPDPRAVRHGDDLRCAVRPARQRPLKGERLVVAGLQRDEHELITGH